MPEKPSKPWVPYFLRERAIRIFLSGLYNAIIGSMQNVHLILDKKLDEIDVRLAEGNRNARGGFETTIRWLKRLREFAVTEEDFQQQFFEPARCMANFTSEIRDLSPSSTEVEGLVFRLSEPFYSRTYGDNLRAISMAIPSLGSVMTLRARSDDVNSVTYGSYAVSQVQPIPYVNRIHPVRPSRLEGPTGNVKLSDLDFMKVSVRDLKIMSRSLAFEDFCEVWSEQELVSGKHGRRLGSACVSCGVIVLCGPGSPYLSLQDPLEPESTINLYVTDQCMKLLNIEPYRMTDLVGKSVRVLSVVWYKYGNPKSIPRYPEALVIEPLESRSEAVLDDIIGFVRIRGRVDLAKLKARYRNNIDFATLPSPLRIEKESMIYRPSIKPSDRIASLFQKELGHLRSLRTDSPFGKERERGRWPFVVARKLLDIERLQTQGLADWVKADKVRLDCLLTLIKRTEKKDSLPVTWKELSAMIPNVPLGIAFHNLLWLKDVGLISKKRGTPTVVSKTGIEIAYLAAREDLMLQLTDVAKDKTIINLLTTINQNPYPLVFLIRALRELESKKVVTCLRVDNHRCELFWYSAYGEDPSILGEVMKEFREVQNVVLSTFRGVSYSLHIDRILEEINEKNIHMGRTTLQILLWCLASMGKVESTIDGLWTYSLEARVLDTLSDNPYEALTCEEIAELNSIPARGYPRIWRILEELAKKGLIKEILKRRWIIVSTETDWNKNKIEILKGMCRKRIIRILKENGGRFPREVLSSDLIRTIASLRNEIGFLEGSETIANDLINEMLRDHKIVALPRYMIGLSNDTQWRKRVS